MDEKQGHPQQGYSPYPPQPVPGYPPEQPPQSGYAPQPAYPPQSGYAPHPGYVPPPYSAPQQVPQQQTSNNVIVVNQPTAPATTTVVQSVGDYYLTLSVVLTVICCFCGTWYSLFCTIPAIVMATSARDAARRGDLQGAQSKGRAALILNIVACIWWVVALIIIIASVASAVVNARNACTYYSYYTGSYYCTYYK